MAAEKKNHIANLDRLTRKWSRDYTAWARARVPPSGRPIWCLCHVPRWKESHVGMLEPPSRVLGFRLARTRVPVTAFKVLTMQPHHHRRMHRAVFLLYGNVHHLHSRVNT